MAGSEDRFSVEKLTSNNYATWKFHAKHVLIAKELFDIVDGSEKEPTTGAEAKAEFKKRKQKAFSLLALTVSSELVYLISDCEEPDDAWTRLQKHFERNTVANKLFLKKQYFRSLMKEGDPVLSHIKHMKELTDKLAAIKAPISEEDQVVTLLGSLPDSFDNIVTALEARVDDLSLDFVHQSLINAEQKRTAVPTAPDAALLSKPNHHTPRACYNCGSTDHLARKCPSNRNRYSAKSKHKAKHVSGKDNSYQKDKHVSGKDDSSDSDAYVVSEPVSQPNNAYTPWIIDSGASKHMTMSRQLFCEYKELTTPEKVSVGDGRTIDAVGIGNVKVALTHRRVKKHVTLYDVLHVPHLAVNLFSVRAVTSHNKIVQFGSKRCWIKDSKGNVRAKGTLVGRMFHLDSQPLMTMAAVTSDIWHQRLAHVNKSTLSKISRDKDSGVSAASDLSFCEGCVEGKMARQPFYPVGDIRSKRPLELVHSDVCTMDIESIGGSKYFVTFIDDYSRCCAVYFMKHKSEVPEKFKQFVARTAGCKQKVGTLRSDRGGEYISRSFKDFLTSQGIKCEVTAPDCPQQNGVAERMNRTLCEAARAMISHAKLPKKFWAEAINTAAYTRNRLPTSAHDTTPYEKWHGKKADLSRLRVFGCTAYAYLYHRKKLDKKCEKVRFVGYSIQSKAYRVYNEATNSVKERRDVQFNESEFECIGKSSSPTNQHTTMNWDASSDGLTNQHTVPEQQARRESNRSHMPPVRYGIDDYVSHVAYTVNEIIEPQTFKHAAQSPQATEWMAAAKDEYDSLMENNTWDLVELPQNRTAIGSKWVFKAKHRDNGEVERYKGRLVAQGFSQRHGVDYNETFSPVVKQSSIRTLLAYGLNRNMVIHQMDVVTAFLNGKLDEEIYMKQPEGFVKPGLENLVCRLRKSLYGLKQSPRCWNSVFDSYLRELSFQRSNADQCVYIRNEFERQTIVAVYVDDLIIMTDNDDDMSSVKQALEKKFKMKDLGKLHYCLGITVLRDENTIQLHQRFYLQQVLNRFGMQDAKPVSTPADPNTKLQKDDGISKPVDPTVYQAMVGSLLYASGATRPDLAQAVGEVSKYNNSPSEIHLTAVKRILRYIKGTLNLKLTYAKDSEPILGYADANWAGDLDSRRSTTGNVFVLANAAVSWLSKSQTVVATSTAEAEYISLYHCSQEAMVLNRLLSELSKPQSSGTPMTIRTDSESAIAIAKNTSKKSRAKHIDIKYHFVRDAVNNSQIKLVYCPSAEMTADMLTKALARDKFEKHRAEMGLRA